ncbi:hypothetical protein B0J12DRAFT_312399 [Macrophomina phaseolina]|uniref:Uncharacterized protein n=1 Tax=Macrophomina phaseolina TaxID=35725 RepID=A0ABQ8FX83_9PEZI|nr:hypothetical protein B0J12DRAFT_312399 [Macrophomina phaseolina]
MCGVTVLAIQRRTNCCCVRSSSCSTQSRKKKRNCSSADVAERILDGHPSYASGRCIPSGADRGGRPDRRSIFVLIMHLFIDGSLKPEPLTQSRYEQSKFSKHTASPPPRTLRDSTCTRFLRPRSENGGQAGPTATHHPQEDARPSGPRPSLRRPDSQSLRSPGSATRPPDPRRTLAQRKLRHPRPPSERRAILCACYCGISEYAGQVKRTTGHTLPDDRNQGHGGRHSYLPPHLHR